MIRVWLIARVVAAWAIGLAVGSAALFYRGSFWDGLEFAEFLAMFSAPLILIAAIFCGLFPYAVGKYSAVWVLGATAAAFLLPFTLFGTDAALSLVVSLPAGVAFMLSVWRWPLPTSLNKPEFGS